MRKKNMKKAFKRRTYNVGRKLKELSNAFFMPYM